VRSQAQPSRGASPRWWLGWWLEASNLALKLAGVMSLRERLCLRWCAREPREPPPPLSLLLSSHPLMYLAREVSALSAL